MGDKEFVTGRTVDSCKKKPGNGRIYSSVNKSVTVCWV